MALCNDNLWGYTTDIIATYRVTWLEAAVVNPCWTSMLVFHVEGDGGHLFGEELNKQKYRTSVRGSCVSYLMPWEDIIRELRENYLDTDLLELPRRQSCLKYLLRVHLNVAGQNLEKHLRQLRVRPFVLLLLLDFLIQRQHELFRNKGSPEELRRKMRRIVQEEYPETEAHVPEGLRQGHVPPSIAALVREQKEQQAKGGGDKDQLDRRPKLFREKHATPGDRSTGVSECLEGVRPMAVCVDRSRASATTPAEAREGAFSGFGHLLVRTGNQFLPQWCPQYFLQVLPFVIPRMVSRADFFDDQEPWRRTLFADAPRVPVQAFVRGFARCERVQQSEH